MPQYYPKKNWQDRGAVRITPRPFLRSLPIIRFLLPYHVGDRVRFTLHIDKPNGNKDGVFGHSVHEKFGPGNWKALININENDAEILGNIIPREGDVEYGLGLTNYSREDAEVIFTASVNNWDTVLQNWFWIILAALFGGACSFVTGILIGLLKINPAWHIWIPALILKWIS